MSVSDNVTRISDGLSDRDRAILDLAARRWNYAGSLEQRVRDELGISLTRFWQLANQLLDDQAAVEYAPQLVYRLRRLRTQRSRTP